MHKMRSIDRHDDVGGARSPAQLEAAGHCGSMRHGVEREAEQFGPLLAFIDRLRAGGSVRRVPEVRPLSVNAARSSSLAHAQAGVLVGAQEAPELEVRRSAAAP